MTTGSSSRPPPARAPSPLTHARVRDIVQRTLEPLPFVHALWEGGSTAFGRDDAWSDVDLQACVDDERVADTFAAVEAAFGKVTEIEKVFSVPEPAWHGHAQRFYRFRNTPPWLMLDFCVMQRSNERRLLEREVHGDARFLFDRVGLAPAVRPLDSAEWEAKLRARAEYLRARVSMFAVIVEKEFRRRRPLDALGLYQTLVLQPLVELLRIRHDPWRHDFGMRYLHEALPPAAARRLEELSFLRNVGDLQTKLRVALRWINELADELARAPRLMYSMSGFKPKAAAPPERKTE